MEDKDYRKIIMISNYLIDSTLMLLERDCYVVGSVVGDIKSVTAKNF
jgi:hypothetical protein